jgi:hypothetical protein
VQAAIIASMSVAFPPLQLVHQRCQPLGDYRIDSDFKVMVARPLTGPGSSRCGPNHRWPIADSRDSPSGSFTIRISSGREAEQFPTREAILKALADQEQFFRAETRGSIPIWPSCLRVRS